MLLEDFHWIMSHDRDSFIATWMFETVDICEQFFFFLEKSSSYTFWFKFGLSVSETILADSEALFCPS